MITLALIGAGRWGQNIIKTIREIPNAHLKYVYTHNYKDLFKHKNINGVIIATPASTHYNIAKDLLRHGYNILVEKPLATGYKNALSLLKISRETKALAMVGHIYLYNPAFIKTLELIKNIGTIQYLDFEGCNWGPFRNDTSALWEWSSHDISMCLEIMKGSPIEISAWGVGLDMVYLRLRFKNDIFAFIKNGWLSPEKKRKVTIVGTKGSIIFDDTSDRKIRYSNNISSISYPSYSKEAPLILEILEFIKSLQTKKKPKTNLETGIKVIRIMHYLEESINKNGEVIRYEA